MAAHEAEVLAGLRLRRAIGRRPDVVFFRAQTAVSPRPVTGTILHPARPADTCEILDRIPLSISDIRGSGATVAVSMLARRKPLARSAGTATEAALAAGAVGP